jgi:uncharacterized protein
MNIAPNRLSKETSPYLLQHANNPVDWFPWGDEAFKKAKAENKLMLISVGYSSCHWCHVMEKEVFSNSNVAQFMNTHFVCVKVDREERPDVDQIYMNAVQIITRSGGWPLNCFTLPDGKPIYGGTYFPPEPWLDVLVSLNATWEREPERVIEVANELTQGVINSEIVVTTEPEATLKVSDLKLYVERWSKFFDLKYGGMKGSPKFPMPGSLCFLIQFAFITNNLPIQQYVKTTLDRMANGGIYDHLGGGFFRYSVDDRWEVPHFEKMLYDNVQFISLYSNAYKAFRDPLYKKVVYETIQFLRNEMLSDKGGLYSAIDADSQGKEGFYYTWSSSEIENLLEENKNLFSIFYGVSAVGNHEGRNVLRVCTHINEAACVMALDTQEAKTRIDLAKAKLALERNKRVRPQTDKKHINAWNAIAVTSLLDAYSTFNEPDFLNDALTIMAFIENNFIIGNDLFRIKCSEKVSIPAFLDDFAFLIEAYISLYQNTLNPNWLNKAKRIMDIAIEKFFDGNSAMFFYTNSEHDNIIARKMELKDGVIPSSSSVMANCLNTLAVYFRRDDYHRISKQMMNNMVNQMNTSGPYVYRWAQLYLKLLFPAAEVGFASRSDLARANEISLLTHYPNVFYFSTDAIDLPIANQEVKEGDIRVCLASSCQKPVKSTSEIISFLHGHLQQQIAD